MNLRLTIAAASMLLLTQAALAHEGFEQNDEGPGPRGPEFHHHGPDPLFIQAVIADGKSPKEGPCSELKLDKVQKAAIKEAFFKFKEEQIDLESNLKRAELTVEKVKFDDKATFEAADAASKAKLEALVKVMAAHESFRNELEFKILKPEQRGPARLCEMMHRHHMFGNKWDKGPRGDKAKKDADKK